MEPEATSREKEATRNILRLLGLPCDESISKAQMVTLVHHVHLQQLWRDWACAERFAMWASLISSEARVSYFYHLCSPYSVVPSAGDTTYRGNALHYAAKDPWLQSPGRMPYAVAMLRYLGCDFEAQEDTNGDCANVLVARAMGSHNVFVPAALLLRWLHNRGEKHYRPCERTCELLGLTPNHSNIKSQ
jgi:hypothetical protein